MGQGAPPGPTLHAHELLSLVRSPRLYWWGIRPLSTSGPPNFASRLTCVHAAHRCKECRRCDAAGRQEVGFNGGMDAGTHRMCAVRHASVHGANSGIPQPAPPARCWLASSGCWPAAMYASPGLSGARPLVGCLEGYPRRLCAADEGVLHAHLTRLPAHSSPSMPQSALSHARLSAHSALSGRQVRTQTGPVGSAAWSSPWAVRQAQQTVAAAQGVAVGSPFARFQIAPAGGRSGHAAR